MRTQAKTLQLFFKQMLQGFFMLGLAAILHMRQDVGHERVTQPFPNHLAPTLRGRAIPASKDLWASVRLLGPWPLLPGLLRRGSHLHFPLLVAICKEEGIVIPHLFLLRIRPVTGTLREDRILPLASFQGQLIFPCDRLFGRRHRGRFSRLWARCLQTLRGRQGLQASGCAAMQVLLRAEPPDRSRRELFRLSCRYQHILKSTCVKAVELRVVLVGGHICFGWLGRGLLITGVLDVNGSFAQDTLANAPSRTLCMHINRYTC